MLKNFLAKASSRYPFGGDDLLQQLVGSLILISPFIFTEEVWRIAQNMNTFQALGSVGVTFLLGHGILYIAHQDRDWDRERKILGVTWRYISLMMVSFGSIALLILITAVTETFAASLGQTLKVMAMISIFSVIGAAVTDSLI